MMHEDIGDKRAVLILTPLMMEFKAICCAFKKECAVDCIVVRLCGMRGTNLERVEQEFQTYVKDASHSAMPFRSVILLGVGGALAKDLAVGDVVVMGPESVVRKGETFMDSPAGVTCRFSQIYTSDRVIGEPEAKATLAAQTGADVVDMEGSIVAAWAAKHGIPFWHIRGVSDAAADRIDPAFLTLTNNIGKPRWGRVMGLLVRRPWVLPALMRLGKNTQKAAENAAICAKYLIKSYF